MDLTAIIILSGFTILIAISIWILVALKSRSAQDSSSDVEMQLSTLSADLLQKQVAGLAAFQQTLDSTQQMLGQRLSENTSSLDQRMKVFGEIENRLGELKVQTSNIELIGRNIQSLSDLLKPPQLRGGLGEILLENLLSQILPDALYQTQYSFPDGLRVDAVVHLADRLLPIDSKFPIEPFQRDRDSAEKGSSTELEKTIKKYVTSIASKYLRPDLNTTDFAVMYIPSEAVYYRFISQSEKGLEQALSCNIIPSSPGHLYAFLASVAAAYRQAGLVGGGRDLVAGLQALSDSLGRLSELHGRLEGSVRRITTSLNRAGSEIGDMTQRLENLQQPELVKESDDSSGLG